MYYSQNGQDRGSEATCPDKARPGGVQTQPVQWNEHVTKVFQEVQKQRRVVAQDREHQAKLLVESGGEQREGG